MYFLNIKNLKSARKVNIITWIKYTCVYVYVCVYMFIHIFIYIIYLITDDANLKILHAVHTGFSGRVFYDKKKKKEWKLN